MEQSQKPLTREELLSILNSTDYSVAVEADKGNVLSDDELKKLLDRSNMKRGDREVKTHAAIF